MSAGGLVMDLVCVLESGDYLAADDSQFIEYVAQGLANMGWEHRSSRLDTQARGCYDGGMIELTLSPTGKNFAVNPAQVVSIHQLNQGCMIRMADGGSWQVVDDYNAVVASINNNSTPRRK